MRLRARKSSTCFIVVMVSPFARPPVCHEEAGARRVGRTDSHGPSAPPGAGGIVTDGTGSAPPAGGEPAGRGPFSRAVRAVRFGGVAMKAVVVYRSHSGVTRGYGEEIGRFLTGHGVAAQVVSVGECDFASLAEADYLFLGCWTSGMFFVMQHPEEH